jgi:phosphopantetheinyl transferase
MIYWSFNQCTDSPPLKTAQLLERFFSVREIEEYHKFKVLKRRAEWFSSRLLAKQLVQKVFSDRISLPLTSIFINKELSGVPYVEIEKTGRVGWLSLSHSHNGVFAAFSLDDTLRFGVDLEFIEPRPLDLFTDYFTPAEVAWLSAAPISLTTPYANLVWSAKEAFLKAIEKGLQIDTRKINIHPPESHRLSEGWHKIEFSVKEAASSRWCLLASLRDNYVMTVCLLKEIRSQFIEVKELPLLEE